jgi:hypothetical protein
VRRNAKRFAEAPPATAEKLLAHALHVQADTMRRRGIDPDRITAEIRSLEVAIRCELSRLMVVEGGAA